MSALDVVVLGAGSRGTFTYGAYARVHPDELRVVAVAEPDSQRRIRFADQHELPVERCFADWRQLLAHRPFAPALICALPDADHLEAAVSALHAGYDVLLEKPMAVSPTDCLRIVTAGEEAGRLLMICHVLRYTSLFSTIHAIVQSGRLGEIVTIEHRENIAYWHMAHSYVRGNWRRVDRSAPMILTKCCHDLDLLNWMMARDPVARLHSFGSLMHFRAENAPAGAPDRCVEGCPVANTCPFYAPRIYLTDNVTWPTSSISTDLSYEARLEALTTGPYGRCVYRCDNDVVDHQVVNMEHSSGAVTTLVMHGHSHEEGRTMRYDGTRGTLRARFVLGQAPALTIHDHTTGIAHEIELESPDGSGHGGGDGGSIRAFIRAVLNPGEEALTDARASLESHLLAFAAEQSRTTGGVVGMDAYRKAVQPAASSAGTEI